MPVRFEPRSILDRIFDFQEFFRFFITGILATVGNVTAVWATNREISYGVSLVFGLLAGFSISFVLGKFFAFRSYELKRTGREILRFCLVYAVGASLYWLIGMLFGRHILPSFVPPTYAAPGGALCGASIMVFTSYFGHKFYTYRAVRSERLDSCV